MIRLSPLFLDPLLWPPSGASPLTLIESPQFPIVSSQCTIEWYFSFSMIWWPGCDDLAFVLYGQTSWRIVIYLWTQEYQSSVHTWHIIRNIQEYAKILQSTQKYIKIIDSNHLSAITRMSLISSSSFGEFRRRNKWYHDSNCSTTSISSRDGSTTCSSLGCFRLWSETSPALKACKRNGKTRIMCRISAARTLAGAEELSRKCSKIVARYGVIGTRQSWTPRYLQSPKSYQEYVKILKNKL